MTQATSSFTIDTDIPPSTFEDLFSFISQNYLFLQNERFTNVHQLVVDQDQILTFTFLGQESTCQARVEVKSGRPILVRILQSCDTIAPEDVDQLKNDLIFTVRLYEEKVRGTSLHFAWVTGERGISEEEPLRRKKIAGKIFFENMYLLFIIFIGVSIIIFMILGSFAPIALVLGQFVLVLFSDRIIARMGDWSVTAKNQSVHLLQYRLLPNEFQTFQQKYTKELLLRIKGEIYEKTLALGNAVDCETAGKVLSKYGLKCSPENLSSKTVKVYEIVKQVAEKFNLPVPKVVIANTMVPNAAASGPSPSHGIVLITTGLLIRLDKDEVQSVVGHEFSHLKKRDPLVLLGIVSTEYLLRIYLFWPFIAYFGLLYLLFFFGILFFIYKFFEARADLESAIMVGQPKILARALKKIGYRKLHSERKSSTRIQSWLNWDPHPPIHFRVSRLEKLKSPEKIKHTLIQSIIDNFKGFFKEFH